MGLIGNIFGWNQRETILKEAHKAIACDDMDALAKIGKSIAVAIIHDRSLNGILSAPLVVIASYLKDDPKHLCLAVALNRLGVHHSLKRSTAQELGLNGMVQIAEKQENIVDQFEMLCETAFLAPYGSKQSEQALDQIDKIVDLLPTLESKFVACRTVAEYSRVNSQRSKVAAKRMRRLAKQFPRDSAEELTRRRKLIKMSEAYLQGFHYGALARRTDATACFRNAGGEFSVFKVKSIKKTDSACARHFVAAHVVRCGLT